MDFTARRLLAYAYKKEAKTLLIWAVLISAPPAQCNQKFFAPLF
jgi:hypothetical protein